MRQKHGIEVSNVDDEPVYYYNISEWSYSPNIYYRKIMGDFKMNTRKLILVECDEEGNEVDSNCLSDNEHLLEIQDHSLKHQFVNDRYLLDKCDRDRFTPEQWDIIEKFAYPTPVDTWGEEGNSKYILGRKSYSFSHATLNEDMVGFWDKFISSCDDKQKFVMNLFNNGAGSNYYWIVKMGYKYEYEPSDFVSCFDWVDKTSGIYYSIDDKGEKKWDFLDEPPTVKQYKYQIKKGRRIAFLSFKDWKEHLVKEEHCRKELAIK